ncbi:hypothetical protein RZS08_14490, partial [Arthrospira platensis SPKY1]|nr:hypothetical protein [Arthrospira platensis SPKY1]
QATALIARRQPGLAGVKGQVAHHIKRSRQVQGRLPHGRTLGEIPERHDLAIRRGQPPRGGIPSQDPDLGQVAAHLEILSLRPGPAAQFVILTAAGQIAAVRRPAHDEQRGRVRQGSFRRRVRRLPVPEVDLAVSGRGQQRLIRMPRQVGDRAGVRLGGAQQLTLVIP